MVGAGLNGWLNGRGGYLAKASKTAATSSTEADFFRCKTVQLALSTVVKNKITKTVSTEPAVENN